MSRTQPTNTRVQNPTSLRLKFKPSEGDFVGYDKESEQEVSLGKSIDFVLLDTLYTVKGGYKDQETGIYYAYFANEVKSTKNDKMTVRKHWTNAKGEKKSATELEGSYQEIKAHYKESVKFVISNYILLIDKTENRLANLTLGGSARGFWFDNKITAESYPDIITLSRGEKETSGVGDFYRLSIKTKPITDEISKEADMADTIIQEYLTQYKENQKAIEQEYQEKKRQEDDIDGVVFTDEEAQDVLKDIGMPF